MCKGDYYQHYNISDPPEGASVDEVVNSLVVNGLVVNGLVV
jgi:hypothetical protein